MKLTITSEDNVFETNIGGDMELENFIAYCQAETDLPVDSFHLVHNGRILNSMKSTVSQLGIVDGDMILIAPKQSVISHQAASSPSPYGVSANASAAANRTLPFNFGSNASSHRTNPATTSDLSHYGRQFDQTNTIDDEITLEQASKVRDSFLANNEEMTSLKLSNPPLADALCSGSLEEFHKVMNAQHKRRREDQARQRRMLTADPFDIEAQRMIAEEIQRQQIDSNMHDAIEFMPEAFGQVHMLYIKCKVNGTPIDAFVDSGAQSTIMSKACAERCNITRLIDKRWSGIAQGVGTQKILGRIHMCQIQIESDFLPSSFSVLEEQPMDMLLGLDMLKRHQCVVDLKENILKIGTTGSVTRFLNESELPAHARSHHQDS